jgi:anti-sigma B factor antagonist
MIQIKQQSRSGWLVVEVSGRADAVTAAELGDQLHRAIKSCTKVAADLSGVDYISSSGIRAILQASHAAQEEKVEFAVCAPSEPVCKIFEISGLQNALTILEELPC